MPELAEVEFYRKQWDAGLNGRIKSVELHPHVRVFRGVQTSELKKAIAGSTLTESASHGKQLLFRFSIPVRQTAKEKETAWLGIHLGMSGRLRIDPPRTPAGKHDHLRLAQDERVLVFSDPRQFGRVLFSRGADAPAWWKRLPPAILSSGFTLGRMEAFVARHRRAPIKAVLLAQRGFPGIGNWLADEILWRARIHPARLAGSLSVAERKRLFRESRFVCRVSLQTIGRDNSDPPKNWLIHVRWRRGGNCPRDKAGLRHETIAGRTTCWCPKCQTR